MTWEHRYSMAMAAGTGRDDNKYEWQDWPPDSLEGMPPKRRRLAGWAIFWFLLLGSLLGSALEATGIVQPWRELLVVAALAAVFVPLMRAAVLETRQLRDEGIELPSQPVTRRSMISSAVVTALLWVIFAVASAIREEQAFVLPLLPIAGTIWLAFQMFRWKRRHTPESPSGQGVGPGD